MLSCSFLISNNDSRYVQLSVHSAGNWEATREKVFISARADAEWGVLSWKGELVEDNNAVTDDREV